MKRRELLLASGALGALATARVSAQAKSPAIIGWLFVSTPAAQVIPLRNFKADLARLGHVEGRDYVVEARWTGGSPEPAPALARELVALKPAVIVTASTAGIDAVRKATATIPIVFVSARDPVESGLVASLARPGGNITGVMIRAELNGKLLELIREILPAARRVAVLDHKADPVSGPLFEGIGPTAAALRLGLRIARVAKIDDMERVIADAAKGKAEAVIAPQISLFITHAQRIGALAAKAGLPLFSTWRSFTVGGGLLSYYSDIAESFARCAAMVDKILRGASPATMAIEQPDRYTLVVNMKTAKALGITIPQSVLLRADEVIR